MLTRHVQRNLTWIDLVTPTPAEVRALMVEFDLDPHVAEELLVQSFKSKVERHRDTIYAILHFPLLRGNQRPEQEIDFVIGKHFLITTRYNTTDPLHAFAKVFEVNSVLGRGTALHGGHVFVEMVRSLYLALADEFTIIARRLQDIEDQIFKGDERKMVFEISHVGRIIHDFRQALSPHREMLSSLETTSTRFFGAEFLHYMHDLESVYSRMERSLENIRDSLIELRETNNSLLSTKQSEVMKTLTVLAFIFLPLSFIANLFAMNTINNPIVGNSFDFWIIVGSMTGIAVIFFIYFKRKGWL